MVKSRPNYRVTETDGATSNRRTVGRHTTGDAAAQARLAKRADLLTGSSTTYGVHEIQHRGGK